MGSSSTMSYTVGNKVLPSNQVSSGLSRYHQHHHYPPLSSQPPIVLPSFEPTNLLQELHATFHPEAQLNPATHLAEPVHIPPNPAIGFAPANNCSRVPTISGYDISPHIFTEEKLSHMLSHGLSKDPKPLLPYREAPDQSYTAQMMAALVANGGVKDHPHLDMVRALNNKWGFLPHEVGLTVDPSKRGLAIQKGVRIPALSAESEFAKSTANLSDLSKQASFSSSSELAQVAAYPVMGYGGSNSHGLGKVESQATLMRMPTGLDTSACSPCKSPKGCHVRHEARITQANLMRMQSGLDMPVCSPGNRPNGCHVGHQDTVKQAMTMSPYVHSVYQIKDEHASLDTHPSFSAAPINVDAREGTQKLCISTHESNENLGQIASSNSEQNGGCGTTIQRVNQGKNKRIKEGSKNNGTAIVANVKDLETDDVGKGKRHKSGASEEDQKAEQSISANSDDSTPTSGKDSSKNLMPSKQDYIHVRARRGQATDSHSLAERVRREKISERMKFLQDLVPGCSKVTGKALMLDEIINYLQSLQRQVEYLTMKLAAANPMPEFHMDDLSSGIQINEPQRSHHQSLMISAETPTSYSPFLHHRQHAHAPQQLVTPCPPVNFPSLGGSDMVVRQTGSICVAAMDAYGEAISQQLTRAWDEELPNAGQPL
eukprot:c17689_g1_i1 orf=568-2538(-)